MSRRTALITGASAGLGVEFARQLGQQGYDLVLVARRVDKLEAVAAEARERFGVTVTPLAADLSDPDAPAAIERSLAESGINVDYLVNNAGSSGPHLLDDRDWTAHQQFYELMMVSVAHMCHRFVPPMRTRGWGRVINVASVAGRLERGGDCNYAPSKAYVISLSESLALTLRGTGVNVCALCPGFTHTDFHDTAGLQEMKAQSPGFLWYDADVVVSDGIEAVEQGKALRVSGRLYRVLDPFMQSVWTRPLFRQSR